MHWLYLLLALAALAVAFKTTSMGVLVLCLLVSFVLLLVWVMAMLAQRVDSRSRGDMIQLDPDELRRLREQAEARKLAAAGNETTR